jgi:hypothetical protein
LPPHDIARYARNPVPTVGTPVEWKERDMFSYEPRPEQQLLLPFQHLA